MNQIDYFLVQRKCKGQLKDYRTYISAEGSYHFLVIVDIGVKPLFFKITQGSSQEVRYG